MHRLATVLQAGWVFGVRDGLLRLGYELSRASGAMARRMRSVQGWDHWTLSRAAPATDAEVLLNTLRRGGRPFFFSNCRELVVPLSTALGKGGDDTARAEAKSILEGTLPFFGRPLSFGSFPPDWFRNPVTGESVRPDRPWTTMRFASHDYGDLKFILESSRFLFVYPLARGYALSGDDRFAEAFWQSVESWARQSPPMIGPLWICGQESSLRILAWSFALHAFLHSPATTPERLSLLVSMIAAHAWRIQQTIGYARSQRSNHLFSEAVGLWTAGTLFPELAGANRWQRAGERLLKEAVLDQITPEGVHLQHSFNYQRMVLQLLLWTLRLAQARAVPLDPVITARTQAAFRFLRRFVDYDSGQVPNYGSNDGTHILPLSGCDYGDFRPLLRMGESVLGLYSDLTAGPWDEAALWMGGKTRDNPPDPPDQDSPAATGYFRLGSRRSWAMVRAGRYHRRPFQADQLHVDLWWHGTNVACDAGSYLYNGPPPWDNGLAGTAVHNTILVDRRDQMRRAGRFLWLDWAQASGKATRRADFECVNRFEGEHDGYCKLGIRHRRAVQCVEEDAWVIVDDLSGPGEHDLQLHWLTPDGSCKVESSSPFRATLSTERASFRWHVFSSAPGSAAIVRAGKTIAGDGGDETLLGWRSPTYGELQPATSLLYRVRARLPVRIVTVVLAGEIAQVQYDSGQVIVESTDSRFPVDLAPDKSTG